MDVRLDVLDIELNVMGARLDVIGARLNAVDGRLDVVDGRLDVVSTDTVDSSYMLKKAFSVVLLAAVKLPMKTNFFLSEVMSNVEFWGSVVVFSSSLGSLMRVVDWVLENIGVALFVDNSAFAVVVLSWGDEVREDILVVVVSMIGTFDDDTFVNANSVGHIVELLSVCCGVENVVTLRTFFEVIFFLGRS